MSSHRRTVRFVATALFSTAMALAGLSLAGPAAGSTGDTAWTSGLNSSGQLGNGTFNNRPTFAAVNVLGDVDEIAGGREHALARIGGQVWAWGEGSKGATGLGSTADQPTPKQVAVGGTAVQIAAGHYSSYALMSDGSVRSWGFGANGQLGNGGTAKKLTPVTVTGVTGASQVAAGRDMAMAIVGGSVRIWGRGAEGQLGNGTNPTVQATPVTVSLAGGAAFDDVVQVAGGRDHVLARRGDGSVWAWGQNTYGQVGDGSKANRNRPVQIIAPSATNPVVDVAAGAENSIAVRADGSVLTWGRTVAGQLGRKSTSTNPSTKPGVVSGLPAIVNVGSGRAHVLAMTAAGDLWGWGQNTYGQLGVRPGTNQPVPVNISQLTNGTISGVKDAHGGFGYSVILKPSS